MRRMLLALMALFALTLTACSSAGTATSLSPSDFQALTQESGVVTLDVRTPAEFASGHLPGAVNLDVESPTFTQGLSQLDPNATYAVYCRSGNRSKTALDQMDQAGFSKMQDLDGGIVAWQSQGLPVVQ
ncbi:MAG: rhodanese-like domain-containing protein [Candidatus Nanopelagicales bacterium]